MQKVHSSQEYNLCCPACGVEVSCSALKAHMMNHHCKSSPVPLCKCTLSTSSEGAKVALSGWQHLGEEGYFQELIFLLVLQMKIAMLRGLLCCVGEEKEDEPHVAYTRQDERSRIFFKLLSNDRSLVLVLSKSSQRPCWKVHFYPGRKS